MAPVASDTARITDAARLLGRVLHFQNASAPLDHTALDAGARKLARELAELPDEPRFAPVRLGATQLLEALSALRVSSDDEHAYRRAVAARCDLLGVAGSIPLDY